MLASLPASMLNQNSPDLGIPNRINLKTPALEQAGGGVMSELKLITPRRNFLIRALGFTAAGATLPIGIVAADDPAARIAHHQAELEKAITTAPMPCGPTRTCDRPGQPIRHTASCNGLPCRHSAFGQSDGPEATWGVANHARISEQPCA
jgi:hypothetical protein